MNQETRLNELINRINNMNGYYKTLPGIYFNEENPNPSLNSALPLYNKALKTKTKEDIVNAINETNKLDESNPYKEVLTEALKTMMEVYNYGTYEDYEKEEINKNNFENGIKKINNMNGYYKTLPGIYFNEENPNPSLNSALPLYNKALETKAKEDIVNAINETNKLDESNPYKEVLSETLKAMMEVYDYGTYEDYEKEEINKNNLKNGIKKINNMNGYYKTLPGTYFNEENPNPSLNSALPLYNKALETKAKEDIVNAINETNKLDESNPYKEVLSETLKAMMEVYDYGTYEDYEKEEINKNNLKNGIKKINNMNRYYNTLPGTYYNEENPNPSLNSALPLYNKALETKAKEDIINAINETNKLDESNPYKEVLTETLKSMEEVYKNDNLKEYELLQENLLAEEERYNKLLEQIEKRNRIEKTLDLLTYATKPVDNQIINNENLSVNEKSVISQYNETSNIPSAENIKSTVEKISSLDDNNPLKNELLKGIFDLAKVHLDKDELNEICDLAIEKGVSKNNVMCFKQSQEVLENKIKELSESLNKLRDVDIALAIQGKNIESIKQQLASKVAVEETQQFENVESSISEEAPQSSDVVSTSEEENSLDNNDNNGGNEFDLTESDDANVNIEEQQPTLEANENDSVNNQQEDYITKLQQAALESNIVDESRVDNEHQYLTMANAKNIGAVDNQIQVEEAAEEEYEYDLSEPDDDSIYEFRPIRTFKNISKNLYDKITAIQFKEKVNKLVEKFKNSKIATGTRNIFKKYQPSEEIIDVDATAISSEEEIASRGFSR